MFVICSFFSNISTKYCWLQIGKYSLHKKISTPMKVSVNIKSYKLLLLKIWNKDCSINFLKCFYSKINNFKNTVDNSYELKLVITSNL